MPTLKMPDGRKVNFPDDMPREQIRSMILKKYPNAPEHQNELGQFVRGMGQGGIGAITDVAGMLPQVPFLSGELPFLPESARQARKQATKEVEDIVNEPSEGPAQSFGKFVGGVTPFFATGGTGLLGLAGQKAAGGLAKAVPHVAGPLTHFLAHQIGLHPTLAKIIGEFVASHPAVANAAKAAKPAMETAGGMVGRSIENRVPGLVEGGRATLREPEKEDNDGKSRSTRH